MLVGSLDNKPLSGRAIVRELSRHGISASSGSACKSGELKDSEILKAMNISSKWRQSGLRFTLGPWLNENDVSQIPEILIKSVTSLGSN